MSTFAKSLMWSAILLFLPTITQAQMVEVERGYVRAPFVRVYRTPDGGTRVRAPFVDVFSDGRRNPRSSRGSNELPPSPPIDDSAAVTPNATGVPTEIDVTEADWRLLRSIVRTGEAELEKQIDRYRAADRWKARLYVGSLRQALSTRASWPTRRVDVD